ncbi:MAG: allantoinase AllB [Candidatus Bathyarchaeota archaeon]
MDLVIKNGRVVSPYGIFEAGIGIDEGTIVTIAKELNLPKADRVIDVGGNLLLPGVVDAHTHFREPGKTAGEDFETGTKAAAAGGVTTVFEMPLSVPCVSSAEILEKRKNIVQKRTVVDFGLYGGAGTHNVDKIQGLAEAGAIGFKTYMHGPPEGREEEYEGAYVTDDGSLFRVLKAVAATGLTSSIHAENNAIIRFLMEKLKNLKRKDAAAHAESRPNFVEAEAISKVIILGEAAGAHVHVAHLTTAEGLRLIEQAKATGKNVTTETCPQYLTLTVEAMRKLGPYAKVNPPLRSERDVEELWGGINRGVVDMVVSDHAPYSKEDKEDGWSDIWKAQSGSPTIETMLPLLLNEVNEGRLSLETLTRVTSERAARIFGVYPKKGTIQVGSDADIVIVDIHRTVRIDKAKMQSKARELTLYNGWKVKGWPIMTILRGEVIMKEGEIIGKPGYGKFVSPLKLN